MPNNNAGVVGTDGGVPIYKPDERWCVWNTNEVFTGTVGIGKYIPKKILL